MTVCYTFIVYTLIPVWRNNMKFSSSFIAATKEFTTYEKFVASPYLRKTFEFKAVPQKCGITVSGLGFYRIWVNGKEITKGILAPYISNPDHIIYYDNYDITSYLTNGRNVLGFQLGNGMLNCPGGEIWDFEKNSYRCAPKIAFCVEGINTDGSEFSFEADESVKYAASPLYFDDLRCGARYDARNEIDGWSLADFDDSEWCNAIKAETPKGEMRICNAEPITATGEEIKPVSITAETIGEFTPEKRVTKPEKIQELFGVKDGYVYDFGVNKAGLCRLKIKGKRGQRIEMQFCECRDPEGKVSYYNVQFNPEEYSQRDVYICKGGEEEIYIPPFTYHGFRYCFVSGITEEQATPDLLTYVVYNSEIKKVGSFACSDETANRLYEMCMVSDLANFYYFPTDCPHREKNGWTGDAALSAEHMLMNFDCLRSFREWLNNIRKAQRPNGAIPGVVPTGNWGYGLGPAWDAVLINLPYCLYRFTGNTGILKENAQAIYNYLCYLSSTRTEDGTVKEGLGDWCAIDLKPKTTSEFTGSVTSVAICKKAAFIFGLLGLDEYKAYAEKLGSEIKEAVRNKLIDFENVTADTNCQTAMAMAISEDIFTEEEKPIAFKNLLGMIHQNGDFLDFGILGARVMFHVLSDFGESDLAYKMITRPEWPSYGHFIEQGLTSLPEEFFRDGQKHNSLNHHFFGDIANWFISEVAGLRYNPDCDNVNFIRIAPAFIDKLDFAQASYDSPVGRIFIKWQKAECGIELTAEIPDGMNFELILPDGYKAVSSPEQGKSFTVKIRK